MTGRTPEGGVTLERAGLEALLSKNRELEHLVLVQRHLIACLKETVAQLERSTKQRKEGPCPNGG